MRTTSASDATRRQASNTPRPTCVYSIVGVSCVLALEGGYNGRTHVRSSTRSMLALHEYAAQLLVSSALCTVSLYEGRGRPAWRPVWRYIRGLPKSSQHAAATDSPTRQYIATSDTMDPPTSGHTRVIAMRISSRPG